MSKQKIKQNYHELNSINLIDAIHENPIKRDKINRIKMHKILMRTVHLNEILSHIKV